MFQIVDGQLMLNCWWTADLRGVGSQTRNNKKIYFNWKSTNQIKAVYMRLHFLTIYYNIVRPGFQILNPYKSIKKQFPSVVGARTPPSKSGTDNVAMLKAQVSILITILI